LQGFSFSQQGWDPANLHRETKSGCGGKEIRRIVPATDNR